MNDVKKNKDEKKVENKIDSLEKNVVGFVPVVKKVLTIPLLKLQLDVTVYVKITSPIFTGKEIDAGEQKKMDAPHMVNAVDLETGEDVQLILNTVLESVLSEEYPDNGYIGKGFSITKLNKKATKGYHPFMVSELEL